MTATNERSIAIACASLPTTALANPVVGNQPSTRGRLRKALGPIAAALVASLAVPADADSKHIHQRRPNVLLIMLDDVGFGDTSTFGGPAQTPVLSDLAASGLRYNRFHTVGLCSPTRAALLSGRNHHRVGFGGVAGGAGLDVHLGYNGIWSKSTAPFAEILRRHGYSTAAFGKWHNTPLAEITPAGPFDRWPTGLGFEYFYGNVLGVSSQWQPELWRNTVLVPQPKSVRAGYHYTTDIVDEAMRWLSTHRSLAPEKPWFMYLATGAAHAPHHVPEEWTRPYLGRFRDGWDVLRERIFAEQRKLGVIPPDAKLAPRPKDLPLWSSLTPEQRRIAERQMEVYAGFVSHTDHEVGKLIGAVRRSGDGGNTLILYIVGDNGASAELLHGLSLRTPWLSYDQAPVHEPVSLHELGGATYMNAYSAGWAMAGNTPFQWAKGIASHLGGTRNPMVASWPDRIKDKGGLRSQFTHVNDIAATVLDVLDIALPDSLDGVRQEPLDGISFAYTFDDAKAPSRHRRQYFETWGNRAYYQDGWIAAARHELPWETKRADRLETPETYRSDRWELYNLETDFSQVENVAGRYPEKLKELQRNFDADARENGVYPLFSRKMQVAPAGKQFSNRLTFLPGTRIVAYDGPQLGIAARDGTVAGFRIDADVTIPGGGAEGAILSYGSRIEGGFVLYVRNDRLVYEGRSAAGRTLLESSKPVSSGKTTLSFEFAPVQASERANSASGRLSIDGAPAGDIALEALPLRSGSLSYITVGEIFESSVSEQMQPPFTFTGVLHEVRIEMRNVKK